MSVKPDDATETIRRVEALRCALIAGGDVAALGALLLPDYVHVHANGRATDKAQTLARIAGFPRTTRRGTLDVRVRGETALVVGEQVSASATGELRGMVTQTLRRTDAGWRFASFHITTLSPG